MMTRSAFGRIGVVLFLLGAVMGCAGGDSFLFNRSDIGRGYLPPVQEVSHPPDSVVYLSIEEKENNFEFNFDRSYRQLMRAWSSSWQSTGSGAPAARNARYRTFATLWSLELSLASLIPERGVESLSKDLAEQIIQERRKEYEDAVQIDIYRFAGSPYVRDAFSGVQLDRPGVRMILRDDQGNEYRPIQVESSVPSEAFQENRNVLYSRNIVYFQRLVDGRDILKDVHRLRLEVRESTPNVTYAFTWDFPEGETTASNSEEE